MKLKNQTNIKLRIEIDGAVMDLKPNESEEVDIQEYIEIRNV